MVEGELEYAVRKAQNHFDKWNDKSGAIPRRRNWYQDMLSIIEDSVKIGVEIARVGIDSDLKSITGEE